MRIKLTSPFGERFIEVKEPLPQLYFYLPQVLSYETDSLPLVVAPKVLKLIFEYIGMTNCLRSLPEYRLMGWE